ncbi:diaminopimelate epimerase [Desulfurobacterium atlanticum]|uniref:Diaminopimelate epimerase n=1 Tax=Desulfurobacterium atlanticum TaxID=240169 RepID=A0A238ZBG8_9BACT|nr:diaminopimelate epimerase [Desulfurobacterium atlanticum]SNR80409.1 diaminopimelate epimerase [Desulfurobacterium atlanticum]
MLEFSKLEGTGNDFIIIDNRENWISNFLSEKNIPIEVFVKTVCNRKKGVGADGLILIENSETVNFRWQFFNSDGSTATMCGNGARCAARYAYEKGIAPEKMQFETGAGIIKATVSCKTVKVLLTRPYDINLHLKVPTESKEIAGAFLNTGVPHFVIFVDNIENVDVNSIGKEIRYHKLFQPEGTNVNFAEYKNGKLYVRTYERGVEGETLACGTGSVASAIAFSKLFGATSPVKVLTRSGEELTVYFDENLKEVYLEGNTSWICDGTIKEEILG